MKTTLPLSLAEKTEIGVYTDFVTGAPAPMRETLGSDSLMMTAFGFTVPGMIDMATPI